MHREIFFHGIIEPETTALLRRASRPQWTFFDVGANEGYYALLAIDLGGTASKVVAFEPQPEVARMLRSSVAQNRYPITVVEAACSDTPGEIDFYLSDDAENSGAASSVAGLHTKQPSFRVAAVTLDDYCAAEDVWPDAVKIDVEGAELSVLQGFSRTLAAMPPQLILAELTADPRHPTHREVPHFLAEYGFRAHRIEPDGSLSPFDQPRSLENVAFIRS